jgi:HK97 family phage portal protein
MSERNWLRRAAHWLKSKRKASPLVDDERGGWRVIHSPWLQTVSAPTPRQLLESYADTAYYCANINARAVARSPLRLFVRTRPSELPTKHPTAEVSRKTLSELRRRAPRPLGDDEAVDEVLDHPLLDLLAEPCRDAGASLLSRFELLELTQLSLDVLGRAYWLVVRDGLGVPTGLWPLAAEHVQPIVNPNGRRLLQGYEWTAGVEPKILAPENVIAFRAADLADPFFGGTSPTKAVFARLGLTQLHLRQEHALLENRARPDVVISPNQPEGMLGDAEARRLEDAFARRFQGDGAGGVFVCRDSLKVDALAYPARDLGELALSQSSIEQIARAFDVPLSMLNRDSNRASAEQGRAQHASEAVAPRLARIADRLNQSLVPLFDPSGRLFVRFDDPVKESVELRLRTRALNLRLGFTTINEERAEEGYPPVPWGDEPWRGESLEVES